MREWWGEGHTALSPKRRMAALFFRILSQTDSMGVHHDATLFSTYDRNAHDYDCQEFEGVFEDQEAC